MTKSTKFVKWKLCMETKGMYVHTEKMNVTVR